MILVDASVWVDHFNGINTRLGDLLKDDLVLTQPVMIGELPCGNMRRQALPDRPGILPTAIKAEHDEVVRLLEDRKL